ncbi:MAG: hypothetical protein AB2A00_23780 [Myxococcota bacterium]
MAARSNIDVDVRVRRTARHATDATRWLGGPSALRRLVTFFVAGNMRSS